MLWPAWIPQVSLASSHSPPMLKLIEIRPLCRDLFHHIEDCNDCPEISLSRGDSSWRTMVHTAGSLALDGQPTLLLCHRRNAFQAGLELVGGMAGIPVPSLNSITEGNFRALISALATLSRKPLYLLETAKLEDPVPLEIFTSGRFRFVVLDSLTPLIAASLRGLTSESFRWRPTLFPGKEGELLWSRMRPHSPTEDHVWMVTGPMEYPPEDEQTNPEH